MPRVGPPTAAARADRAGFTLVEALVVLAILAAAAATVAGALTPQRATASVVHVAHVIAADLRGTRTRAVSTRAAQTLTFDTAAREFIVGSGGRRVRLPESTRLTLVTASIERMGETTGRVRFYPDGASSGGRITLEAEGRVATVTVDWLTGSVQVHEARP